MPKDAGLFSISWKMIPPKAQDMAPAGADVEPDDRMKLQGD